MPKVIYPGPNVHPEVGQAPTLHGTAGLLTPGENFIRDPALAEQLIDSGLVSRAPEEPVLPEAAPSEPAASPAATDPAPSHPEVSQPPSRGRR